jgi:hypothetical protein
MSLRRTFSIPNISTNNTHQGSQAQEAAPPTPFEKGESSSRDSYDDRSIVIEQQRTEIAKLNLQMDNVAEYSCQVIKGHTLRQAQLKELLQQANQHVSMLRIQEKGYQDIIQKLTEQMTALDEDNKRLRAERANLTQNRIASVTTCRPINLHDHTSFVSMLRQRSPSFSSNTPSPMAQHMARSPLASPLTSPSPSPSLISLESPPQEREITPPTSASPTFFSSAKRAALSINVCSPIAVKISGNSPKILNNI